MNRPTLTLVLIASGAYYAVLFLARSLLPVKFYPPPYLLALPLGVLVLILVSDLSNRAAVPSAPRGAIVSVGRTIREFHDLRRKIDVGATASPEYFDEVLRAQLRHILVEKVSLETGIPERRVRESLADPIQGNELLRDKELYSHLYGTIPARGPKRVRMIEETVEMLEAWKP